MRPMPLARPLAAVALAAALAGCGQMTGQTTAQAPRPAARPTAYHVHGLTAMLPDGWHHASGSLTPALADPREVLAVGTFALRYRRTGCAHVPGSALEDLGAGDAFLTLEERGLEPGSTWPDFPARPAHFGASLGGPSEASACVPAARFSDHWFGFSDAGRHFQALVAFGPAASAATRTQAWEILDALRVDPAVRPDWPSSG
jgi:hypothetical protein